MIKIFEWLSNWETSPNYVNPVKWDHSYANANHLQHKYITSLNMLHILHNQGRIYTCLSYG